MQRDTLEFIASFVVGTVVGAAAAAALRPRRLTRKERILEEIRRRRRRLRAESGHGRGGFAESAATAKDVGRAVTEAGREVAMELRGEILGAAAEAVERFASTLADHLHQASGRRPAARDGRRARVS